MKRLTNVRQSVTLWGKEIEISELMWDDRNLAHISKHSVSEIEVEEACVNQIYIDKTYADRLLLVGRTSSTRMISVVLVKMKNNQYYVVTARDSSRGERRKAYEKEANK